MIKSLELILSFNLLQGLGVTRRFLEDRMRERVIEENVSTGKLEIRQRETVLQLTWNDDRTTGRSDSSCAPFFVLMARFQ